MIVYKAVYIANVPEFEALPYPPDFILRALIPELTRYLNGLNNCINLTALLYNLISRVHGLCWGGAP